MAWIWGQCIELHASCRMIANPTRDIRLDQIILSTYMQLSIFVRLHVFKFLIDISISKHLIKIYLRKNTFLILAKGSKITATYTQPLWKTLNRREHLKMSKCFWCRCQRCRDPTEFGTGLSTLICNECGGKMLPMDPLDSETCWK